MLYHLKKRKSVAIVALILLAVSLVVVYMQRDTNIPKLHLSKTGSHDEMISDIDVQIKQNIEERFIPVYSMKPIDATAEENKVRKIFKASRKDIALSQSPSYVELEDTGMVSFSFNSKNGCWSYHTDIAYYTGENVPTEKESIQIAENFISQNDIFPMDALGDPKAVPMTTGDGISQPTRVLAWDVYYYPKVDGKDVYGVYRICISVGSDGKIVGVDKLASEYELVKEVPVKSKEQLYSDFMNGDFTFTSDITNSNTILSNADLIFYVDPHSEYIQPVVRISDANREAEIIIDAHQR